MTYVISKYELFKNKNISLGNKNILSSSYKTIKINYKADKLFIQTPYILNRYRPSNYDSKITLDIPLDICNEEINKLYKMIIKLHRYLKIQIKKDHPDLTYSKNLKKKSIDETFTCFFLKTKINCVDEKKYLKVYNSDKTINEKGDIPPGKEIRFILYLDNIWIFKKTYGFNWFIVQAEIKLPEIFESYFFDQDEKSLTNDEIISNNPSYKKFFKMVSVGVSKEAVKLRMDNEGLDGMIIYENPKSLSQNIFDKFKNNKNIPAPPPLNLFSNKILISSKNGLDNSKEKNNMKKNRESNTFNNCDFRIPTQKQLLEKINEIKNKKLKDKETTD